MPRPVHFEIPAQNPEKLIGFYQTVFGWTAQKWDGPMPYWMITTGRFPVLLDQVPDDFGVPALAVAGEIYHVDDACLAELDRLERAGIAYDRKVTGVFEAGHKVAAYIYVGVAEYWHPRRQPAWTGQNQRSELLWSPS